MRMLLVLLSGITVGWAAEERSAAQLREPIPEVKLTNGVVFRNVTVVRYERERVVLKSSAGVGPLTYSMITEPIRSLMLATRDSAVEAKPAAPVPTTARAQLTGIAFSAGTDQPYRFAAMHVQLISKQEFEQLGRNQVSSGYKFEHVIADTDTDIEGKFAFEAPPGSYVVYAEQSRSYRNHNRALYQWLVPVMIDPKGTTITLNDQNATLNPSVVQVLR